MASWVIFPINAIAQTDSLLIRLNQTIEKADLYDQAKLEKLKKLHEQLSKRENLSDEEEFRILQNLSIDYETFISDSAFVNIQRLQKVAYKLKDPVKIAYAKIRLGFTLLSSGMFKETLDSLGSLDVKGLPDSIRFDYYFVIARTYYDLGDFDKDKFYTPLYNKLGSISMDSAKSLSEPNSYTYKYLTGLQNLKNGNDSEALSQLKEIMEEFKLTPHQVAVTATTLSFLHQARNETDEAIKLLALAAIADIESATKETVAMSTLAEALYRKSDIKNACVFIQQAMEDAVFYGARQRKRQV